MQRKKGQKKKSPTKLANQAGMLAELHIRRCIDVVDSIAAFYETTNVNRIYHPLKGLVLTQEEEENERDPIESEKVNYHFALSGSSLQAWSRAEQLTLAHANTWRNIQPILPLLSKCAKNMRTKHNILAFIFNDDNKLFLSCLEDLKSERQVSGELLLIAAQRLKHIGHYSQASNERKRANKLLTKIFTKTPESVLFFNQQQMKKELINLHLFTSKNPGSKKIVWLGSQRMVNAHIARSESSGTDERSLSPAAFLLCDDNKWSWMLNRLWLQACTELDFEILLIEQQFPNMAEAMLSGDIVQYIVELMKEIRPNDKTQTSQYSSEHEPTATALEVLALMDMGCMAKKNSDGSISFHKAKTVEAPEYLCGPRQPENHRYMKLMRRHSCSGFFDMPPPPRLDKPSDHFVIPVSSPELRSKTTL